VLVETESSVADWIRSVSVHWQVLSLRQAKSTRVHRHTHVVFTNIIRR